MQNASAQGNAKKFELTKTTNPIKGTWGNQVTCAGPNTATCANGMDNMVNCMHQTKGYYYRLVADTLQKKLNAGDLDGGSKADLEADIKAVQGAIDSGNNPVDPAGTQQRWLQRLTSEDQQKINQANSKYMREVHDDCDKRFGGMSQYSSGN
jgi:hypothetical protein